jgi:hypothetical protein
MPGFASVGSLQYSGACTNHPTAIVVDERTAQQQVASWRLQANPVRTSIRRSVDGSALAEGPAASARTKDGPNHASINISTANVDPLPMFAAISCIYQISARVFFCFQFVNVPLANDPTIAFVGEINIAQHIFGGTRFGFPTQAAIFGS